MFRHITLGLTALSIVVAPASVSAQSRGEVRRDRQDVRQEQQELRDAQRYGSRRDVKEQRRDVKQARQELREDRRDYRQNRSWQRDTQWQSQYQTWNRYDYNRPDPRYGGYYADRYYRDGNYSTRRLSYNDRVYRGQDGRYYCRRNDGTTGLVIGALGGGVLGNAIAPGGSKTLGAVIGGGLGALLGQQIARDGASCR